MPPTAASFACPGRGPHQTAPPIPPSSIVPQEYGHQVKAHLGTSVDLGTFDPFVRLQALVRRALWLLGQIPDEPADDLE